MNKSLLKRVEDLSIDGDPLISKIRRMGLLDKYANINFSGSRFLVPLWEAAKNQ